MFAVSMNTIEVSSFFSFRFVHLGFFLKLLFPFPVVFLRNLSICDRHTAELVTDGHYDAPHLDCCSLL